MTDNAALSALGRTVARPDIPRTPRKTSLNLRAAVHGHERARIRTTNKLAAINACQKPKPSQFSQELVTVWRTSVELFISPQK
jgi:hypothetical protein